MQELDSAVSQDQRAKSRDHDDDQHTVFCVLAKALVMYPCIGVRSIIVATPASEDNPVTTIAASANRERSSIKFSIYPADGKEGP